MKYLYFFLFACSTIHQSKSQVHRLNLLAIPSSVHGKTLFTNPRVPHNPRVSQDPRIPHNPRVPWCLDEASSAIATCTEANSHSCGQKSENRRNIWLLFAFSSFLNLLSIKLKHQLPQRYSKCKKLNKYKFWWHVTQWLDLKIINMR